MGSDGAAEDEQRSGTETINTITGGVFHGTVIQTGSDEQRPGVRTTNTITGGVFQGVVIQAGSIDGDGLTVFLGPHGPLLDDLGPADALREEQSEN